MTRKNRSNFALRLYVLLMLELLYFLWQPFPRSILLRSCRGDAGWGGVVTNLLFLALQYPILKRVFTTGEKSHAWRDVLGFLPGKIQGHFHAPERKADQHPFSLGAAKRAAGIDYGMRPVLDTLLRQTGGVRGGAAQGPLHWQMAGEGLSHLLCCIDTAVRETDRVAGRYVCGLSLCGVWQ